MLLQLQIQKLKTFSSRLATIIIKVRNNSLDVIGCYAPTDSKEQVDKTSEGHLKIFRGH